MLSIKYNRILSKVYKKEHILEGLSTMIGSEIRLDWIGRMYSVINPYIKNGVFDQDTQIFELGVDTPVEYIIEKFIMERMNIASKFIQANNLFDLLTYRIKKLDDNGNYLFTMYPIPYEDLKIYGKRFLWVYGSLLIVGIILLIFL